MFRCWRYICGLRSATEFFETPHLLRFVSLVLPQASDVFALLMGDKVAPRRAFIEKHGHAWSMDALDI